MRKFKIGDKVRVTRNWTYGEAEMYNIGRIADIDRFIGYGVYTIVEDLGVGYKFKESGYVFPGCVLEIDTAVLKFKVGDEVVVTRNYTDDEAIEYNCLRVYYKFDELVGRSFKIMLSNPDGSYILENCGGQWFPECVLMSRAAFEIEQAKIRGQLLPDVKPEQPVDGDRCTITLERFGADGKKYVSGCVDITERGFEYLWDEYIEK